MQVNVLVRLAILHSSRQGKEMEKPTAIAQIKKACNQIATELMSIHPATTALGEKPVQDEIYKAIYELTKNLEMIKKQIRKVEVKMADASAGEEPPLL
jgi:hypothetical protein